MDEARIADLERRLAAAEQKAAEDERLLVAITGETGALGLALSLMGTTLERHVNVFEPGTMASIARTVRSEAADDVETAPPRLRAILDHWAKLDA